MRKFCNINFNHTSGSNIGWKHTGFAKLASLLLRVSEFIHRNEDRRFNRITLIHDMYIKCPSSANISIVNMCRTKNKANLTKRAASLCTLIIIDQV